MIKKIRHNKYISNWRAMAAGVVFIFSSLVAMPINDVAADDQNGGSSLSESTWKSINLELSFYDPGSGCSSSSSGNNDIMGAKNADKQSTDFGDAAQWSDTSEDSMQKLLDTYGDLAVRTGNKYGAPYIAILVQMRYEQPTPHGSNNFWGIGHPPGTPGDGFTYDNLGKGFIGWGETFMEPQYDPFRNITDPSEFLEKFGEVWVSGHVGGATYGEIDGMKNSVDVLTNYINKTGWNADGSSTTTDTSGATGESAQNSSSDNCSGGPIGNFLDDSTFTFYNQCDEPWGTTIYGDGTMCANSCGISSFAMAATALLGKEITPADVRDVMTGLVNQGKVPFSYDTMSEWFVPQLANEYGLQTEVLTLDIDAVNKALGEGKIVHLSGMGSTPFSSAGHYIIIRGELPDGNWKIGDSGNRDNNTEEWEPSAIAAAGWHGNPVAIWR